MKSHRWILGVLLLVAVVTPAFGQQRVIVRDTLGLNGLKVTCVVLNCKVAVDLGDPSGQLFLVTVNDSVNLPGFLTLLQNQLGVTAAEVDQKIFLLEGTAGPIPESLVDSTPIVYYGSPVWHGYVYQPAARIVHVLKTQNEFHVAGRGTVAMIDTGVDTQHPALSGVLVPGYNFVSNTAGGDETGDVNQSSAAVLDGGSPQPTYVNSSTIAVINQSSAAVLDSGPYAAFGHGTMTAGIVHLVAPKARIMPLKAFSADGSGYVSDIIHATYYATQHGSKVISMSFSFTSPSKEMMKAINNANGKGVICVASAGNDGGNVQVYPAALNHVMGVGSTSDYDTRSSFSNYGEDVWVAAPGEGVITTYPYGTYSAGWGTSFSAPFVSGTAALLADVSADVNQQSAASAIAHARWISNDTGNGRLDVFRAVQSWVETAEQ